MRPFFVLTALSLTARLLPAQSSISADQLADWQRNRITVLAYIDAMPDSATGFRPTRGVRSLAEQFDHIVTTNLEVAAIALRGEKAAPALGDSSVYLLDKAALRKYAAATYDYLLKALQEAKAGQLSKRVAIYGQPPGHALVRAYRLDPGPGRALPPAERSHASRIPDAVLTVATIHLAASLALLVVPPAARGQSAPPTYRCRFVPVPVRDGVHLNTSVCQPDRPRTPLPFLLTRTPYGIAGDTVVPESYRFFAADGYIFVSQDIRGRYRSEGQFIMQRPLHDSRDT